MASKSYNKIIDIYDDLILQWSVSNRDALMGQLEGWQLLHVPVGSPNSASPKFPRLSGFGKRNGDDDSVAKMKAAEDALQEKEKVSFVNSIATIKGGTHVDYVTNQITNYVTMSKSGIVESLLSWADFKQSKDLKKTDRTKRQRITGITKLEDANDVGGKSSDKCTLILTEGVSAKAVAMAGISVVGQNYYGVFPLRGKLLNVREASHKQIMENAEIQSIKQILGLQHGKQYDSVKTLRYGHLMIMTDQTLGISIPEFLYINIYKFSETKVKHSRTSSPSSYEKDFCELVDIYTRKKRPDKKKHNVMLQDLEHDSDSSSNTSNDSVFEADSSISCGEFFGQSPDKDSDICGLREINDPPNKREEGLKLQQGHLEGSTIIYVPTRKETLSISKFLCKCGVKAAAYNAKLPRSHLRQVHNEFHENALQKQGKLSRWFFCEAGDQPAELEFIPISGSSE
ncbi:hypothetical protein ACSBR1_022397 [Camellia fascicularis]